MSFQRGFSLITVLAIVIMIAMGTATLLRSMGNVANLKSNMIAEIGKQYLAEAGVHYANWLCRTSSGTCTASTVYNIDGTAVTLAATALTGVSYAITSTVNYTDL